MPANYNCLLFDLDGTLLDFDAAEQEAILTTLEHFDLGATEENAALYARINNEYWQKLEQGQIRKEKLVVQRFGTLLEQLGKEGDLVKINNFYTTCLSTAAHMYPGADELLAELAEFATLAVTSNGNQKVQMKRLEKSGLLPYFDDVFVSEKLGATKPAARFFEQALKALGIRGRERVLVIGDSLSADIKGGQNAKLDTCWCNLAGVENDTDIQPTHTVKSYAELKIVAVGEEELKLAETREKRHMV